MRKKFTFSLLLSIVIFYTFTNNSNNTVSPLKSWNTCANAGCHSSSGTTTVDSIILLHPTTGAVMTGFYPDSNYKIRMVGSNTSGTGTYPNFGFQLRGINTSSALVGTFQTPYPTNTGIGTGIQMLTNSAPLSPTGGKYIVEATWKAPTGTTSITLQSVINAVNANSGSTGDAFSSPKSESYNVLGIVSALGCTNRRLIGNITSGTPATGVSFKVPYTGGNGGAHFGQTVPSTGVTGLTATLTAGNFISGNDSLTYTVTGTASGPGTANFALNIGLKTCSVTATVTAPAGVITSLDCATGRTIGNLTNGQASSGVSFKVPYTGGNSGTHSGQANVASTGVTGLTANLAAGNFVNGNDSVTYTVTGTPVGVGAANFALSIGGRSCSYAANVNPVPGTITALNCANGKLLATLMNGSATVSTDSFKIPYTGGNGGAQSGQIVSSTGVTGLTATLAAGNFKTGNDSVTYSISGTPNGTGNATFALNIGGRTCNFIANVLPPVGVLSTLDCSNGSVSGTLSNGIAANSVSFTIPYTGGNGGTYLADTINSTTVTGLKATIQAGLFANGAGSLTYTVTGTPSSAGSADFSITRGGQTCAFSIIVNAGIIAAIDCGAGTTTGSAIAGAASNGLSFNVPYSGGNGGQHGGQTINSTNISGLTATLAADTFVTGAGSVTYNVVGTPSAVGNANFAVNIGGKTCTYVLSVGPGAISNLNCGAGTSTGTLMAASAASGVSFNVPYTGGNGGLHAGQTVSSTGVTGLTATLGSGNFANGSGSLTYFITGTPATFGTADFFLNIGGKNCLYSITVSPAIGVIAALNCPNGTTVGALTSTFPANGISFSIPYSGGNNGSHSGDIVNSTGVTGLTATLPSGLFANGNGNLTYTVSGTPVGSGNASFALNIGGKMCTYNISVKLQQGTIAALGCGQISTTGTLKGDVAATGVSFKLPYTGGNGGLYSIIDTNSTGVTGFIASSPADTFANGDDTLRFNVTGMSTAGGVASFTILIDGKTCIHTIPVDLPNAKINGGLECSNIVRTGTLVRTEAASGVSFTTNYTLGNNGVYSAQTINSSGVTGLTATITADTLKLGAGTLMFNISGTPASAGTATFGVTIGGKSCNFPFPVSQPIGTVATLDCDSLKLTYTEDFMAQIPLAGVSLKVPYTGANGGSYPAISVASTGVTGLTAAANAGIFATGNGNIVLSITGTPASSGNAEFSIHLGGKTCNYVIPVSPLLIGTINSLSCGDGSTTSVLIQGTASNGTSFSVPYDGGNRGYHFGQTIASTGVTGLTAKLNSGQFAIGFGYVSYSITGTPSAEGTASFALNIGGKQCTYSIPVRSSTGQVLNISCDKGQTSSSILVGTLNPGVFFTIPYQGGNGGPLSPQAIQSTGVTGLTAQNAGGVINFGDGVLRYNLSGTTTNGGWANFAIQVGNQQCIYAVLVNGSSSIINSEDNLSVFKYGQQITIKNHKEDLNYSIVDLTGKTIKEAQLRKTESSIDLKTTNLSSGTYFILLQGERTSTSLKFIVE